MITLQINSLINKSIQAFEAGRLEESKKQLQLVIKLDANNFFAYSYLGFILAIENKHAEARNFLKKAVQINPEDKTSAINLIKAHLNLKEFTQALQKLTEISVLFSDDVEISYLFAKTHHGLNRLEEAANFYTLIIESNSDFLDAFSEYANVLCDLKRYEQALSYYDHVLGIQPLNYEVCLNKGTALNGLKKFSEAINYYDKVLEINPRSAEALLNKGKTFFELKNYTECISLSTEAIKINPKLADAWFNMGTAFLEMGEYERAISHLENALKLSPDMDYILGDIFNAKIKICDWTSFKKIESLITAKLKDSKDAIRPFTLLSLTDNPSLQLRCSTQYSSKEFPYIAEFDKFLGKPKNNRIKVAYLSPDFRDHPVSYLITELIESHNPEKFETFGFYFGPQTSDPLHARISRAFHHFIDINELSDFKVAQKLISLNIDIAVDLTGSTKDSRTEIFKLRCAPIQINYLGYPGTSGASFMDYIIADKEVVTTDSLQYYCEAPIFMPNCFQVNDSKRKISNTPVSRELFGLPSDQFVFCCFNGSHKLNPTIFNTWAKILKSATNSVLWLIADNNKTKMNIVKEMVSRGLKADRLFFAERLPYPDHLARYLLADLFLDTLPFNGGTTTSDALWAGLPVLTQTGKSFAARMSTSLLKALELNELICSTEEEYISKALELVKDNPKLTNMRELLASRKKSSSLFNGEIFAHNLELAYRSIFERFHNNLKPKPLDLS